MTAQMAKLTLQDVDTTRCLDKSTYEFKEEDLERHSEEAEKFEEILKQLLREAQKHEFSVSEEWYADPFAIYNIRPISTKHLFDSVFFGERTKHPYAAVFSVGDEPHLFEVKWKPSFTVPQFGDRWLRALERALERASKVPLTTGPSDESLIAEITGRDFIVKMAPVKEYTVRVRVRIEKATPRIAESEGI